MPQQWKRDDKRMIWRCHDGRTITDEAIANMDPHAAQLLLDVLRQEARP